MKMLVNGGLHCSVLDGWWDEAYAADVGWAIGDAREHGGEFDAEDAHRLYELLEEEIAPEFYDRDGDGIPRAWVQRVRSSMTKLTEQFSSDRMVREYVEKAYLPAAQAYLRREAEDAKLAKELAAWVEQIDDQWSSLRFGRVTVREADQQWNVEVQAYLGDLCPDAVAVQLYADAVEGDLPTCVTMHREGPIHGAVNGFIYRARVPMNRPAEHYTPRIVPSHPDAFLPLESRRVCWNS
jgi:starch phosphorylase